MVQLGRNLKKALILAGVLSTGMSCGPGNEQQSDILAAGPVAPSAVASGSYARQLLLVSDAKFLGLKSKNVFERLQLVKLKNEGDKLTGTVEPCAVNYKSTGPDALTMSPNFVSHIPRETVVYKLKAEGSELKIEGNRRTDIVGAKLVNLATDPMPQNASDGTVLDQDQDGKPGMSVDVTVNILNITAKGQVYIANKTTLQERAVVKDPKNFSGNLDWTSDQSYLGGSTRFLETVKPKSTPALSESKFAMRKISDQSTCASLLAERATLFPPLTIQ